MGMIDALMMMYDTIESKISDGEATDFPLKACLSTAYEPLVENTSLFEYEDIIRMVDEVDFAKKRDEPRMERVIGIHASEELPRLSKKVPKGRC